MSSVSSATPVLEPILEFSDRVFPRLEQCKENGPIRRGEPTATQRSHFFRGIHNPPFYIFDIELKALILIATYTMML